MSRPDQCDICGTDGPTAYEYGMECCEQCLLKQITDGEQHDLELTERDWVMIDQMKTWLDGHLVGETINPEQEFTSQ